MCPLSKQKINPLNGAADISAFTMPCRLAMKTANEEDFDNSILIHAMRTNTAGQLGNVVAGSVLLSMVSILGF